MTEAAVTPTNYELQWFFPFTGKWTYYADDGIIGELKGTADQYLSSENVRIIAPGEKVIAERTATGQWQQITVIMHSKDLKWAIKCASYISIREGNKRHACSTATANAIADLAGKSDVIAQMIDDGEIKELLIG